MSEHQLIDYTGEGFIMPIIRHGIKGYASVNSIMHRDEDGLDRSGGYFIYILHPTGGSTHFTLEPENSYSGWKKDGGFIWLTDDIVQEITNTIENRKKLKNAQSINHDEG